MNLVVVMPTTHLTLKAETVLENAGINCRTVMKPRKISSDCGLAIRIDEGELDRVRQLLDGHSIETNGYFREGKDGWDRLPVD